MNAQKTGFRWNNKFFKFSSSSSFSSVSSRFTRTTERDEFFENVNWRRTKHDILSQREFVFFFFILFYVLFILHECERARIYGRFNDHRIPFKHERRRERKKDDDVTDKKSYCDAIRGATGKVSFRCGMRCVQVRNLMRKYMRTGKLSAQRSSLNSSFHSHSHHQTDLTV